MTQEQFEQARQLDLKRRQVESLFLKADASLSTFIQMAEVDVFKELFEDARIKLSDRMNYVYEQIKKEFEAL
jgi:hypothetical protein